MEGPVVGFVGRFHRVKGIDLLLKTAALVQARRPDLHVVLVGGTKEDLYPAAAEALAMLPRPEQVRFVPFATATERLYPAFTLFTLCSESEAFPNVVLEAMACGVPCATTDAGDCRTMLKDLGEVVLDRDPQTMAAAWERLLSLTSAQRENLEAKSHGRAVNEYSMARAAQRFEAVYDALSP
jgi:glycosyltransferase involved in cell wall biosynthesis